MTTNELFFLAAKNKWRFNSSKGLLSVEDLFELPLTGKNPQQLSLDQIAVQLYRETKNDEPISFVKTTRTPAENEASQRLELVKAIIADRQAEADARVRAADRARRVRELQDILADKESEALRSKTPDEIRAMLLELSNEQA